MSVSAQLTAIAGGFVNRADSWINALTGLGTVRDKVTAATLVPGVKLSLAQLEALWNDDDIAQRICSKVPREATRRGFTLELEGAEEQQAAEVNRLLVHQLHHLSALQKCREAWIWGRLYGGGAVLLGAEDGQDPALPLDENRIASVKFLNVLKAPQLHVSRRYADPGAAEYGEPELYEVHQAMVAGGELQGTGRFVHATRLVVFRGALTAAANGNRSPDGWDDSSLQAVYAALQQTTTAWQSAAHLIADASQGVLSIANLVDMVSEGGQAALRVRMTMMDMARSVCRAILVDADREKFERVATSFAGLPEMLDRLMLRMAAAAEMPVTVLFGRSPAGMNATGESDVRGWYDTIQDAQRDVLMPRLERLVRVVMLAKDGPTRGQVPEHWSIQFRPLWQPTDLEVAQIHKLKAETHVALVTAQIEMEAEAGIGMAREFPWIDAEHRRALLKADLAEGLRPGEATTREQPEPEDEDEPDGDEA